MGTALVIRSRSSKVKRISAPALLPPACIEVRLGKTAIMLEPNEEKTVMMARSNPAP